MLLTMSPVEAKVETSWMKTVPDKNPKKLKATRKPVGLSIRG